MSDDHSYFNGNENNELPEGSKTSRDRVHRDAVEASAILGLRRLEVLRRALGAFLPRNVDAVTLAWIGSLGHEVAFTAEGHAWTVSDEAYPGAVVW